PLAFSALFLTLWPLAFPTFSTSAFMGRPSVSRRAPARRCVIPAPCCASPGPLVHDMIAAVDIERVAGDQPRLVERQERGGGADVVDAHQRAGRRLLLRLGEQLVELGDAGGRAGRE